MNTYGLLLNNPNPTIKEIEEQFDGNLCRCTGYRSIADALREFASDKVISDEKLVAPLNAKSNPHQEPALPPEHVDPVEINYDGIKFFIPTTLEQLIDLKKQYPKAPIIVGSSEIGMDIKLRGANQPVYISSHKVDELYNISIKDDNLVFGANTSLQDILTFCDKMMPLVSEPKRRLLRELRQRLSVFSSTQIRNTATVTGNIVHAGAVTDMSNFLLSTDAKISLIKAHNGEKQNITMDDFFVSYRKTKLDPDDVLTQFSIPLCKENEHVFVYKQAHRREDDICIVSSTMKCRISPSNIIEDIKIAYSGMAAFPQNAKQTQAFLKGKEFTLENIRAAYKYIEKDLPLDDNAPGGHVPFRRELSRSFLFRFYHQVQKERGLPYDKSATEIIPREQAKFGPSSNIHYNGVKYSRVDGHVGNSPHHRAAIQQTTGEASFTADLPMPANGLYGALVMSPIPHGIIKSADYSKCLEVPGVIDVVTYKDVKGINLVGDVIKDEPVFPEKEVQYVGHPIALVLAEDNETAWKAAKLAKFEFEELPAVLNIDQAIAKKSFYPQRHHIKKGDPDAAFKDCDHVIEGVSYFGGQEHFYLETQNCLVEPLEDRKLRVTSSTQNPSFLQAEIARCTGVPYHNVDVGVVRLGGGFGGKETRSSSYANFAAVAAMKVKRPIKIVLDRDVDMETSGGRHPYQTYYKVGFTKDGLIKALSQRMYAQCGWSSDISIPVTDRSLMHSDSSYYIPNFYTTCYLCKTNTVSNTAYRGFGAPQGIINMESIITHVAEELHKSPEEIRKKNLYREGQTTHFGVPLINCNNISAWEFIEKSFDFASRRKAVDEFNKKNSYKKRGLALTPLKFGIAFTNGVLNQAGSLVHIYKDGSVLVSHGGIEMGQGLNTKIAQVAATTLNVPLSSIRIDGSYTNRVANTSPTAASTGADVNGWAVYNACMQINARLNKYRTPDRTFAQACLAAYQDKVDLCAHGYYGTPGVFFDWERGIGNPFSYYVYGASASEVEIDCLTGDHVVHRTDLVYDVGSSINPAIDIGQVEGGFLQGYGLLTLEEIVIGDNDKNKWVKPGKLQTNGPGYYKIPGYNDVPTVFNANLLPGGHNPTGIYSSKAIGEPPLLLAASAAFALYDAIKASRKERGLTTNIHYKFPVTSDHIRMLANPKI